MSNLFPTRRDARNFIDQLMIDPFDAILSAPVAAAKPTTQLMTTDIKETEKNFEMVIDLPGFKKEDVQAELKDGYLTVSAKTSQETVEENQNATYIRKERFSGACSRTFFVGDEIEEADISAKFENGTLVIDIPKKLPVPKVEGSRSISIC